MGMGADIALYRCLQCDETGAAQFCHLSGETNFNIMASQDSGTGTNRGGKGSTYGGTQSPDPDAPDGYQKPKTGEDADNTDQRKSTTLGDEYADDSSYGKKEPSPDKAAGEKGQDAGTDAAGSGVR
jgi:hypothetical protein